MFVILGLNSSLIYVNSLLWLLFSLDYNNCSGMLFLVFINLMDLFLFAEDFDVNADLFWGS